MTQEFTHHPDFTCLAQAKAFDAGHHQIQRFGFMFSVKNGEPLKEAVKRGIAEALEARQRRGIESGRLHVELDSETSGRVIDHLPIDERGDAREFESPVEPVDEVQETEQEQTDGGEDAVGE